MQLKTAPYFTRGSKHNLMTSGDSEVNYCFKLADGVDAGLPNLFRMGATFQKQPNSLGYL